MHKPESFQENKKHNILWDYEYSDCINCREVKPFLKKGCSKGEAPILKLCGVWSSIPLLLHPGPLLSIVIVPVKLLSIEQIDMFKNCYLIEIPDIIWPSASYLYLEFFMYNYRLFGLVWFV